MLSKNILNNPRILIIITIFLWALNGVSIKLIASSKTFMIFAIGLWASTIVNFIYFLKNKNHSKSNTPINIRFMFFAACGYLIFWFLFLNCIELYDDYVSVPMVLNYTWPFFTGLLSIIIFKVQKFTFINLVTILCGLIGVMILGSEGSIANLKFDKSITGLFFGLGAGISYGFFSSFASTLSNSIDTSKLLLLGTLLGAIGLSLYSYFLYGNSMLKLSILDWTIAFFEGLILDAFGYIVWTRALAISVRDKIDITISTSSINFLPLFSILLIAVFYQDERSIIFETYYLVAFTLILIGTIIPNYRHKYKQ